MHNSIQKRIIQTGKCRRLPLRAQAAAANLKLLNPTFDYMFFDDSDVEAFVDARFPQYRALFDSFSFRIQKYDFFRYLAVYHFGGFYFDLDVLLVKGLDDLCMHGCVLTFEELSLHRFLRDRYNMDWEVGNYAFGAAAGHPFIRAIIENCVRAQMDPGWSAQMWQSIPRAFRQDFYVLDTTGPGLVSRTLAEFPDVASQVTVLFPDDVCDVASWHQFGDYGVHIQEGGWRTKQSLWRRRLRTMWETRTRAANLQRSRALGPERSLRFRRTTQSVV
jgi:inositol phosphorylceramide mannosyltransferase catalytic subunit